MATILLLDASLIGLTAVNPKNPEVAAFKAWAATKLDDPAFILTVADVTWYEARRGVLGSGDLNRVKRIDDFCYELDEIRVTREAWRVASELWADLRARGQSVADPKSLDGDAVLAGVAQTCGQPADDVIVITRNKKHLARFGIRAEVWQDVA